METMRWVLKRDGMKSNCQPMKCHQIVFRKACTKHAFESVISSRPCWLYDQDILQKDMPPSYQRPKTTVKKFLDLNMRALNFEARNERTMTKNTGEKQKHGEVRQRRENAGKIAVSGKQKGSVQGKMLAAFATITVNVEPVLPLPLQNRRRTTMGKFHRKAGRPEGAVHPRKGSRNCAQMTSREIAQVHRVIHGTLPCVKITNHKQAASLA